MAKDSTPGYVKSMLVAYYHQTKDKDIGQESLTVRQLYEDLLSFFVEDEDNKDLFANSDIISKTGRHYRQHFLDRFDKKNKDRAKKTMISIQHFQVQRALQLRPQQPNLPVASASKRQQK